MEKVPMTATGHASLEIELKRLLLQERPRIIQAISDARTHGDLSENAEYHAAKEAQSLNEGRIAEIEDKLSRAEVIDVSKLSGDTVKFGAKVTVMDEDTEEESVYQIVGDVEADVREGRVSISSPIARALIGKTVGDTVEVTAPGGARSYEILRIKWDMPADGPQKPAASAKSAPRKAASKSAAPKKKSAAPKKSSAAAKAPAKKRRR
jgi:transcription elongation factor GreA